MAYVYAITVDGVTRYIGKGTGTRLDRHFRRVDSVIAARAAGLKVKTTNLHHRLIKARLEGRAIAGVILFDNLSDGDAFEKERALISNTSGLWNLREGGAGFTSGEVAAMWADPDKRLAMSTAIREAMARAAYREKRRALQKAAMLDPLRGRAIDAALEAGRLPAARKRQGEALRKSLATPAGSERMRAAAMARWSKKP